MWNIFEQPWTLLGLAAVLLMAVAVVRSFIEQERKKWLWLIPLLTAAAAISLDYFIETDREKIEGTIETAVEAIEKEDCNSMGDIIDENYRDSRHRSKSELMRNCRGVLREPLVDKVYDSILEMEVSGDTANVVMLNRIFFDEKSRVAQFAKVLLAKVEIELRKTSAGDWLISRTEVLAINNQPTKWNNINYRNW